jgi:uncharacterized membrane protein
VTTDRLEAFSDGVFAIAITLLVLNIRVPTAGVGSGGLWSALRGEWPTFAAYLTSFLIIGIMWVNHHSMFRHIVRVDRPLLFLNLLLLLWTALLPFPTSLVARYVNSGGANAHVAAAVYSTNLLLAAVAFSAIWAYAVRGGRLISAPMPPAEERQAIVRFGVGTLAYAFTIGLAFVSAPATLAVQFAIALYYCFEQVSPGSR